MKRSKIVSDVKPLYSKEVLLCRLKCKENVGAIYRLAFQYGVTKIYSYDSVSPGKTNTYKTERHIPVEKVESLDFLGKIQYTKIALETDSRYIEDSNAKLSNSKIRHIDHLIAVFNESMGCSESEKNFFDIIYSLKAPNRESYNVSHALAIALHWIEYA